MNFDTLSCCVKREYTYIIKNQGGFYMNKYEIQITNPKTGYTGTIIINTSHGNKIREIAENKLYNYINIKPQLLINNYWAEYYQKHFSQFEISHIIKTEKSFSNADDYDIICKKYSKGEVCDMETIDIYDYMYWGDYNAKIKELAEKALPEKWSFEDEDDYSILKNYLKYTFNKLQEEDKIIETDSYCVFNTGLFSHYYEPIYAYGELNRNESIAASRWYFKGFKDTYELGILDIVEEFPERADYFSDPSRLVFNWHLKVNKNYKHILDDLDASNRLPNSIKNSERPLETLKGVIDTAIQKVIANYKLAVPHYYQNKIQLLVPLCFGKDDNPDVALVLDLMKSGYYQATTCLSTQMAYTDARLIAKPESNWLMAENIKEQ